MLADHTFVQEQQLWLVERNELAEHEPRMAGAAAAAGWLLVAVGDDAVPRKQEASRHYPLLKLLHLVVYVA